MSHRENGLTPWIKNNPEPRPAKYADFTVEQINAEAKRADISDEDKHAINMIRTGHPCTVLPPKMYDDAVAQGCDMTSFVKNKPLPISWKDGHMQSSKLAPSDRPAWPCPGSMTKKGNPK